MAFTGFSSDEEGSIVFDGEQFIINNPDNVPVDFDPGDRPVIGLPVTHPSHPINQVPTTTTTPTYVPPLVIFTAFDTHRAEEHVEHVRKVRESESSKEPATPVPSPQVIDELPPDIAADEYIDSEPLPLSDSPDWPGNTPLSHGRSLHVDHLLSVETDTLAREVLIGIKRDGIPPKAFVYDFMAQYAEWGWDDLSSARALQVLELVRQSDWDERLEQADSEYVEAVGQDLANDWIEGLVIIDAGSGNIVLNKTGVVGAGGQQYVGLQDYEVEAFKGIDLIFVHNHTEDVGASVDDLNSAFDAGAKLLIVITRNGREFVYVRGRDRMVLVRDETASYEVGPPTLDETIELAIKSAKQAVAYQDDPPEHVFLQEEQFVVLRANGDLRVYEDEEAVLRGDDDASTVWPLSSDRFGFRVLDQNPSLPYLVKIEVAGNEFWIDLRDSDAELEFRRVDLASTPFLSQRAQVSEQKYDNTSLDFLSALTEALNPQPISVEHGDSATGTPPEHVLQSIVGDDEEVPVEMSFRPYDASGVGLISQDYNKITDIYRPFQVQSPVVGPDVRVEFVVPAESNDTTLGNYVVISFPASVYLVDKIIMQSLSMDLNHAPSQWREDGRIFVAYGHLSVVYTKHIYPGNIIDTQGEAIIGITGNTGLLKLNPKTGKLEPYKNTEDYHENQHLDLAIVYYGSNTPGEMAAALQTYRTDSDNAHYFFGYAQRSTLLQNDDIRLYGENIDPERIPGLF